MKTESAKVILKNNNSSSKLGCIQGDAEKCLKNTYATTCFSSLPFGATFPVVPYYLMNGECVATCGDGYYPDDITKTCKRILISLC